MNCGLLPGVFCRPVVLIPGLLALPVDVVDRGECAMAEQLFPEDSADQTERRIERAWESLRSSRRDDPDRIQKAHDAYLSDPTDDETS